MTDKIPVKLKSKDNIIYAIQRKSDGLYSRGGTPPRWDKFPKTWGIGSFKNHLLQFKVDNYCFTLRSKLEDRWDGWKLDLSNYDKYLLNKKIFPYFDCEVIRIDFVTLDILERFPAEEWIWNNAYKPHYEKMGGTVYEKYLKAVREFCVENDLIW